MYFSKIIQQRVAKTTKKICYNFYKLEWSVYSGAFKNVFNPGYLYELLNLFWVFCFFFLRHWDWICWFFFYCRSLKTEPQLDPQ